MATIYRTDNLTNETEKIGDYWTRAEALGTIRYLIERDYVREVENRTDRFEAFALGRAAAHDIAAVHDASHDGNEFLSFRATYRLED